MKADYVHKDTLTESDYVELNKNYELLVSYNQSLLKENQELKQKYENAVADYETTMYEKEQLKKKLEENKNFNNKVLIYNANANYNSKKFINYLEDEIKRINPNELYISELNITLDDIKFTQYLIYKEILQKYKSIIGGNSNE